MIRNRRTECSDGSLHGNLIGNDIRRVAPMHLTDRNDNRITSVCSSGNRLINECDEVSRGCDWINRTMWPRRMTSTATYLNNKILAERGPRSRRNSNMANRQSRIDVQRDNGINPFQCTMTQHFPGPVTCFLRRLKYRAPANRNRPGSVQGNCRSKKYRGVRIMAAGVHDTRFPGTIRNVVLLLDRKRIDVGA